MFDKVVKSRVSDDFRFMVKDYHIKRALSLAVCSIISIPNRTLLVHFGNISGEFGQAMVRILARRSGAKIPMARPNEHDMPPKRTKKVRLGIYRTQIRM